MSATYGDSSADAKAARRLAELFEGKIQSVAAEIIERLSRQFPEALDQSGEKDLEASVLRGSIDAFTQICRIVAMGGSLESLGPSIELAARRRRGQHFSQEMVLAGHRLIQEVVFERISRDIAGDAEVEGMLRVLAQRQYEFTWVINERVAAAFGAGADVVSRNREQSMQDVLEALFGQQSSLETLERHTASFGLRQPLDHLLVSTLPSQVAQAEIEPQAEAAIVQRIARAIPWALVGQLNRRLVVLSRGTPSGIDLPWCGCTVPAGALHHREWLAGLIEETTAGAEVVLSLGLASADASELTPFIAVAKLSEEQRNTFLRHVFGPLQDSPRGYELLKVVSVSLRYGNRQQAASVLNIHANTLDYKLNQFREQTSLDLKNPLQRARCDLGLFLHGLLKA